MNETDNESSKFATRKWHVINDQDNGERSENDSSIKFETAVIKSSLCDYSDVYVLVIADKKVAAVGANTNIAFNNCALFTRCVTHINYKHIDTAENHNIIMPMHNLIEYGDNYSDTSRSLYQFKRDESPLNNVGNPIKLL